MTVSSLSPDKAVVGCVGLGIMGAPAARNMRRAGYGLRLFARRRETLSDFADLPTLESPKHLAAECDVVVVNVSDTPDVEEVALGDNGIIAGMRPGGMVIDMSTIAPAAARRIAGRLREKNIAFLDAPVSGGQQGAIDGTLTMMVGGEEDAFARALPLLQAMAKSITRIGDSGAGQVAKMCNQIIIGATIEGVAEAIDLAQKTAQTRRQFAARYWADLPEAKCWKFTASGCWTTISPPASKRPCIKRTCESHCKTAKKTIARSPPQNCFPSGCNNSSPKMMVSWIPPPPIKLFAPRIDYKKSIRHRQIRLLIGVIGGAD